MLASCISSNNEGDEGICQQIVGTHEKPPGLSTKFMLSAAAAAATRKFKSVGGILKTILFFSYLVDSLPWALFQQDIWTGALSRAQSLGGKSDASCLTVKSHAFSDSPRKFETAGVRGERKMNRANSDFYEVSGTDQ